MKSIDQMSDVMDDNVVQILLPRYNDHFQMILNGVSNDAKIDYYKAV